MTGPYPKDLIGVSITLRGKLLDTVLTALASAQSAIARRLVETQRTMKESDTKVKMLHEMASDGEIISQARSEIEKQCVAQKIARRDRWRRKQEIKYPGLARRRPNQRDVKQVQDWMDQAAETKPDDTSNGDLS